MKNQLSLTFAAAILFLSQVALAAPTVCTQGSDKRNVEVVYKNNDGKAPCEVIYTKGEDKKAIFNANTDTEFCNKKAEDFINKLKGLGWTC